MTVHGDVLQSSISFRSFRKSRTKRRISASIFEGYFIERKVSVWKEVFMAMLVEIAMKTKGKITPCKMVNESSQNIETGKTILPNSLMKRLKSTQKAKSVKKKLPMNLMFGLVLLMDVMDHLLKRYMITWTKTNVSRNSLFEEREADGMVVASCMHAILLM